MGDNGHAPTGSNYRDFVIDLRKILKKYRITRIKRPVHKKDQLVLCVNQRMAYIYLLDKNIPLSVIADLLKNDSRIDIIAWKNEESIHVVSGRREGSLDYHPSGQYTDVYQQSWSVEGNLELLDLQVGDDNRLTYGDYPDALARVYGALHSQPGRFLVVNAKPGCDFKAQSTPFHLAGAAHGSLHRQESLVPLVIAGADIKPKYPRLVDMKEYILNLMHS